PKERKRYKKRHVREPGQMRPRLAHAQASHRDESQSRSKPSMLKTRIRVLPRTRIEPGMNDGLHRLSFREIAHHHRRLVAHLFGPLTDQHIDLMVLQRLDFRPQRIG